MIDDRENTFPANDSEIIAQLCNRRFGIGADGLILLQQSKGDFRMLYFNADGSQSTMCGNGGRCFVRFLKDLKLIKNTAKFLAIDGYHYAEINEALVKLQMQDVHEITQGDNFYFLNTGSPHHVIFTDHVNDINIKEQGASVRYSKEYPQGTNVNFVEVLTPNRLYVRTYERGVEDETYSCGTGVTAAALAYASSGDHLISNEVHIKTPGGNLLVTFEKNDQGYHSIYLIGPATAVFKGKIKL